MLAKFDAIIDKFKEIEMRLSIIIMVGIILLNIINLILRWFVGIHIKSTLEISLDMFVWGVLMYVPVLNREKKFIRVELLQETLSKDICRYINLIIEMIVFMFFIYLMFYSLRLSLRQVHVLSRGLGIPRTYVTISLPVATFLTILVSINNIIHQVKDILQKR